MRTLSLEELRNRLERLTGTERDTSLTEEFKNEVIAAAVAEWHDLLIDSGLAEQFVKKVSFQTTADQMEYEIDGDEGIVTDEDFYKIHQIYVDEGGGHLRPIDRINPSEITYFQPPQQACTLWLYYIPSAETFKDEDDVYDDEITVDFFNGGEEFVLNTAAIAIKQKKSDDFNQFYRRKKDLEQRVKSTANTDWSGPSRVVKRWKRFRNDPFLPHSQSVNAWGLRGGNLEIYANTIGYLV